MAIPDITFVISKGNAKITIAFISNTQDEQRLHLKPIFEMLRHFLDTPTPYFQEETSEEGYEAFNSFDSFAFEMQHLFESGQRLMVARQPQSPTRQKHHILLQDVMTLGFAYPPAYQPHDLGILAVGQGDELVVNFPVADFRPKLELSMQAHTLFTLRGLQQLAWLTEDLVNQLRTSYERLSGEAKRA